MNSSVSIFGLQAAFTWVWQSSLAGAIVIGLIGLLHLFLRKWLPVGLAYWLWCCALLRLLLPITPASPLSLFNLLPRSSSALEWRAASREVEPPTGAPSPAPVPGQVAVSEPMLLPQAGSAAPSSPPETAWTFLNLLSVPWILGGLVYLVIIFWRHGKLSIFLSQQKPIDHPRLQDCIAEGMRLFHLRGSIRAYEARHDQAPAIFGFFRPRLLVSKSVLNQLSPTELRLLVLHEVAHVARRDVLLNWLVIFIQALHWFNPFVWLGIKQWRTAREAVCDAQILSLVDSEDRHTYGTMLLKIAAHCFKSTVPGLVPIFKTKKEIHRRIIMIAQFKPATRLAAAGSAAILILVAAVTLTVAGEKAAPSAPPAAISAPQPPPATITAAPSAPVPTTADKPTRSSAERLEILQKTLNNHRDRIQMHLAQLDAMRNELGITEEDEKQRSESGSILLRKIQSLKADANVEYIQVSSLVKQLSSLSRAELRKAVPVVSPDPQISNLLQDYAASQQTLVELSDQISSEHPDLKRVKSRVSTIDKQINERLDGVLAGLKAREAIAKAKLHDLDEQLHKTSHEIIEKSQASRYYFELKRTVESEMALRDHLQARIQEEELNALLQDK